MPKFLKQVNVPTGFVYALYDIPADKTADYTIVQTDSNKYIRMNKGSASVLTVPVLLKGTNVKIFNASAFDMTLTASGTTFNNAVGLKVPADRGVELVWATTTVVDVIGFLTA